ncbi:uncharacterized protein ColSpa_07489 [Colletotrichum spaethianum]|uniref:Uncharacterized protein n=1 Tax=Colletotrichum spaethianum TaxID=700344 RepID=A0AA37LF52_9PEZI|nr:uncharacterized protein ColSpa_07489 [Colletotrichum spaethianum]GKT47308.1 hypothetical protein ColSpa_07489 [Colletotrichum spaethianum]
MQVIRTLRAKFNQVKLPKTFLAINLSDLFSFEDTERRDSDSEGLEMKALHPKPKATAVTQHETETESEVLIEAGQALASASSVVMELEEPVSPKTKSSASDTEATPQVAESSEQ